MNGNACLKKSRFAKQALAKSSLVSITDIDNDRGATISDIVEINASVVAIFIIQSCQLYLTLATNKLAVEVSLVIDKF